MDSKRCSNGKEMIKEHFLTTFHNMNSTAFLRFTGQFKGKKKKRKNSLTKHISALGSSLPQGLWRPKGLKGLEKSMEDRFHQGLINTIASLGNPGTTAGKMQNIPAE